jgi:putative two-component system response regulator
MIQYPLSCRPEIIIWVATRSYLLSDQSVFPPDRPARVLIVEDDADLVGIMRDILETDGHEVITVRNGPAAIASFTNDKPDLILSDIMMPDMDGFAVLQAVRSHPDGLAIPFLFVSARTERRDLTRARDLGADDFIFKPFGVDELSKAVRAKLERKRVVELFNTRSAHLQTVTLLANAIEARDKYTRGHVERVRTYALQLARALEWGAEALIILEFGALLHDIGKISVPEQILNKTGPLDSSEWEQMRQHPEVGARMLEGVDHLHAALPYVLYHHERWDGKGYPHGIGGEEIPPEGRLLAVVDAYDAMTTSRPYRKGLSEVDAVAEIHKGLGVQFDPTMGTAFLKIIANHHPNHASDD